MTTTFSGLLSNLRGVGPASMRAVAQAPNPNLPNEQRDRWWRSRRRKATQQ